MLADLNQCSPAWTVAPQEAILAGMSWLSLDVAHQKLTLAREALPAFDMHLVRLDMVQLCVGTWIPTGWQVLG